MIRKVHGIYPIPNFGYVNQKITIHLPNFERIYLTMEQSGENKMNIFIYLVFFSQFCFAV